jgi:hypothetical protein
MNANDTLVTMTFENTGRVRHGGFRLVSGGMVAIQAPGRESRWELYSKDETGLEVFGRYATENEKAVLDRALTENTVRVLVKA